MIAVTVLHYVHFVQLGSIPLGCITHGRLRIQIILTRHGSDRLHVCYGGKIGVRGGRLRGACEHVRAQVRVLSRPRVGATAVSGNLKWRSLVSFVVDTGLILEGALPADRPSLTSHVVVANATWHDALSHGADIMSVT